MSTNSETKCSEIVALINVKLSYLCENVNNLADICNGRHKRHTPVAGTLEHGYLKSAPLPRVPILGQSTVTY